MKPLLIITAALAWPFFIVQILKTSRGVLGQITGAVNNSSRGLFDRNRKFRQHEREAGWKEFKGGERGGKLGSRVGLGVGVVAGQKRGTRGQLLTSEGRRQAAARQRQIAAAKNSQENQHLQQLNLNDDDGIALMGLGGKNEETARAARDDLYEQWMAPRRQELAAQLTAGTISQADHDTQLLTAEAEVGQRADRALESARTAGFSHTNAQSALALMAQNKSRAIDPGNWDIVQRGINRLAGSNAQEAGDLRDSFQFFSRGAGRFDLGGNAPGGGVARAGLYQIANAHPSTIRGSAASYTRTFADPNATDEQRMEAARFFNELEAALPNATGEVRNAILEVMGDQTATSTRNAWLTLPSANNPVVVSNEPVYGEVTRTNAAGERVTTREHLVDAAGRPRYTQTSETARQRESRRGLRTLQREDPNIINSQTPPTTPPPSDKRLKTNINHLGKTSNGINIYSFEYIWSSQVYVGVIAQEVMRTHPEAISTDVFGFYRVDYHVIGLEMMTLEAWNSRQVQLA
jgi:Chaperone of endosialidase